MATLIFLKEALYKAWDYGISKLEIDLQRDLIEALYDDQTKMAPKMSCITQTIRRLIQLKWSVQINHAVKEVNLVPAVLAYISEEQQEPIAIHHAPTPHVQLVLDMDEEAVN